MSDTNARVRKQRILVLHPAWPRKLELRRTRKHVHHAARVKSGAMATNHVRNAPAHTETVSTRRSTRIPLLRKSNSSKMTSKSSSSDCRVYNNSHHNRIRRWIAAPGARPLQRKLCLIE